MIDLDGRLIDGVGAAAQNESREKGKSSVEKAAKESIKRSEARDDSEKMLLRWVRTSLTLITTGAAGNRTLQYLEDAEPGRIDPHSVLRWVTVALVILGIVAIWAACVEHGNALWRIERDLPPPRPSITLGLVVGLTVAILAVVALLAMLTFRTGVSVTYDSQAMSGAAVHAVAAWVM